MLLWLAPPVSMAAAIGAMGRALIPGLILERLIENRSGGSKRPPDALDLMIVCVEAGSGLDQAISKRAPSSKSRTRSWPELR
jgi:pilus assembly protein TadC